MKDVPCVRHQLNTYCWSHELPRLHTIGQMVGTPTALSATPSAPPPHCRPTGHHSNYPVGQLVISPTYPVSRLVITPTYPVGRLVITPTPLSAAWSPLQHILSAAPSAPPPHCRPTGHHSNPTVGRLVTTSNPTVGRLVITPTCSVGRPIRPPPHCRPPGHHSNIPCRPTGHQIGRAHV